MRKKTNIEAKQKGLELEINRGLQPISYEIHYDYRHKGSTDAIS